MFAVKGWSVDASALKPQTEVIKAAKPVAGDDQPKEKQGRKRKRGEGGQPAQNGDVGKLWDQHIEGKEPVRSKGQVRKERKKQKLEKAHTEKVGREVLPSGLDKPKGMRDIEKPEDIVLGTRAEKRGKKKRKGGHEEPAASTGALESKQNATNTVKSAPPAAPPLPTTAKLTPMQSAMRQKLISARFRHLNQTLYTAPSGEALELFNHNPEMFEDYHAGFRQQVSVWPENPIDNFIATLQARGKVKPPSFKDRRGKGEAPQGSDGGPVVLPRTHGTCIIADLGCGDARLAQTLKDSGDMSTLNLKVHSFDLHSPSPLVTKADISSLPLEDGSVDIAMFCLALMGTNWISFIEEAYRILHWKGELWVAEIKSRFGRVGRAGKPVEHSVGSKRKQAASKKVQDAKKKEDQEVDEQTALRTEIDGVETQQVETDVSAFVDVLKRRGFLLKDGDQSIDLSNKMFVKMEFIKAAAPTKGKGMPAPKEDSKPGMMARPKKKFFDDAQEEVATDDEAKVLKPCLYKIR